MADTEHTKEFIKLYNKLLPSIKKMINNYSYLGLLTIKFEELMKNFLLEIYTKNSKEKHESEYYIKTLKSYLDAYIKLSIKEPENTNKIINNYINQKLTIDKNSKENIQQLKKLSNFLEKYDFIPTPDTYVELIKTNQKLLDIVKQIVDSNLKLIEQRRIDELDTDPIVISLIEVYCMLNNISYQNESETEENIEFDASMLDQVGAYLLEIQKPLLSAEEEKMLAIRASNGDKYARDKLIERNLKWVVKIARKYQNKGLDIAELIQEGNIGLITAVDRFDYTKGYRLTTYSIHWIRQSIQRAIQEKSRNIRIPVHISEKLSRIHIAKYKLEKQLNREPTLEEIAKELKITVANLEELIFYQQDTLSLNVTVGDEEDTELSHFIPSDSESLDEIIAKTNLPKELQEILKRCNLSEREVEILLLRNGFYNDEPLTLEEVGQMFGVTRERIRQIENKALRKIRMSPHAKSLALYTDDSTAALGNLTNFKEYYKNNYGVQGKTNKSLQKRDGLEELQKELDAQKQVVQQEPPSQGMQPQSVKAESTPRDKRATFTIFEKFQHLGYTREEVLSVIPELPNLDMKRLRLRNGHDLDNPIISEAITDRDRHLYITITLPKIEELLKQKYGKRELPKDAKPKVSIYEMVNAPKKVKEDTTIFEELSIYGYTREEILSVIPELSKRDKKRLETMNGTDLDNPVREEQIEQKIITSYKKITLINIRALLRKKYGYRKKQKNKEKDSKLTKEQEKIISKIQPDENGKEEEREMKLLTTFEYLEEKGCSKEEALKIIATLSDEEKNLIKLRNGGDLENPVYTQLEDKVHRISYARLLRKIVKIYEDNKNIEAGETKGTKTSTSPKEEQLPSETDKESLEILTQVDKSKEETPADLSDKEELQPDALVKPPQIISKTPTEQGEEAKKSKPYKGRKRKNIFERMGELGYDKEQVQTAINSLSEEDKAIIKKMDGDDLENPITDPTTTRQEAQKYQTNIIPKIKSRLKQQTSKKTPKEVNSPKKEDKPPVEVPVPTDERTTPPKQKENVEIKDRPQPIVPGEKQGKTITTDMEKTDYIKILELLKTPTFKELMTELEPKTAVIIALRLGYIEGKYFSTESIANFLEIEQSEVIERTKEILTLYKNKLNETIDTAITYLGNQGPTRKLELKDSTKN